jgi:hypothetical protein
LRPLDTHACLCYVPAMANFGPLNARPAPSPSKSPLAAAAGGKIHDTMNFMNFAPRPGPFGALEFAERHATSGTE